MRKKPNANTKTTVDSHWEHNDIYRKFRREFDFILDPDSPYQIGRSFESCYVDNKIIEDKLKYVLDSSTNTIQFLIGRTGIGKSTLLRHVFHTFRTPLVNENSLIVPFSFDSILINTDNYEKIISGFIRYSSVLLKDKFNIEYNEDEFIQFIEDNAGDLLYRNDCPIDAPKSVLLTEFKKTQKYTYNLEELKYYISKTPLERAIFLVDDIEGQDHIVQELIISCMCSLYNCLKSNEKKVAKINLVFSVRPMTESLIRHKVSTFGAKTPIIIKETVSIKDIFKARLGCAINEIGSDHITDKDSWNEAFEVLSTIIDQLYTSYGYNLLLLFNNNIRRTLVEFQFVITNRTWIQKGEEAKASFKVNYDEYVLTNHSILQALGKRNEKVYPIIGTCIVNIFKNKQDSAYDLLIIYLIRYFVVHNEVNEHLDIIIKEGEILSNFKKMFAIDNLDLVLTNTLKDMVDYKLLNRENLENGVLVYTLQPRAKQLLDGVSKSSTLLELFRDDTYQDFGKRKAKVSCLYNHEDIFVQVFYFIDQIYIWEKKHVDKFKINNPSFVVSKIGNYSIFENALKGISNSLNAYFQVDDELMPGEIPEHLKTLLINKNKIKHTLKIL